MTTPTTTAAAADTLADFNAFARAALKIAPHLIDAIPKAGRDFIDGGLAGGSSLVVEFGPLPAFHEVAMYLVEREGRRHKLSSVTVLAGPQQ